MMVKTLKIKEDSKMIKQVKPIKRESPKIDSKRVNQVKPIIKESINKKLQPTSLKSNERTFEESCKVKFKIQKSNKGRK